MLRMSLYSHPNVMGGGSTFGYAYAYQEIHKHLLQYKYNGQKMHIDLGSPKSKVQLYFGSPPGFFYKHQYKIQMTQWESTRIQQHWVDHATEYNEWWTANQFGANAFIEAGVPQEKMFIYEHGIDSLTWTPKKRGLNNKIRFLHIDSGSPRKRSDLAIEAFKIAFGNNPNYELTLKYSHEKQTKADWSNERVLKNFGEWESINIRHIRNNLSLEDMVNLFHYHDVLIYPSEGEGFGLIPLQALATGMPVISTSRWCSYDKYFNNNIISSHLGVSDVNETYTRPGFVVLANLESMIHLMKSMVENFENQSNIFYNQIPLVVDEYNWQTKTNAVINDLIKRIGVHMFKDTTYRLGFLS